ncbi:MAG TPA: sugar phosphate isomerase/epimerase [Mycobacteriales bacterium]
MKLGCNTVVFGGFDLRTALEHVAFAGYAHVELAAISGMCEHLDADAGAPEIRRVSEMVAGHGLTPTAIEAGAADRERLERVFGVAEQLGVTIVNIGSGGASGDEESTVRAIANIADLAKLAGGHGVRLAVKPHVGQAIFDARTALRLMAEVDEEALGLNFDPSHLYRAGEDPADVALAWGDRIVTSHIRDCASRERAVGPPETQIPGRGAVDLPAVLAALTTVGFAGPLNLEVIGATTYSLSRAMGVAAESRGYLHRCLSEIGR